MSNQQETSLAWLAGILDGEGAIGFNVRRRHRTRTWKPKDHILPWIQVGNTSFEIIQKCSEIAMMVGVPSNISENGRRTKAGKIVWTWVVAGAKRSCILLPRVIPYLILKKARAEAVMSFIESRRKTGLHKTYTSQELQFVQDTREGSSETTREAPVIQ